MRSCPVCGDGFFEREENIAMSVKRFVRKVTSANNAQAFVIETDNFSAQYISRYLDGWENEFRRKIFLAGVDGLARGKFRLEFQGNISDAENVIRELRHNRRAIIYKA